MIFSHYKKRFLIYLNKENVDHMEGVIDPFEFHTVFLVMAKLFSVMDDEEIKKWMYISPVCTVASALLAMTIFAISCTEYVRTFKIHNLTECGTYFLIMVYKLLIVYSIMSGKKYYHNFLQALRDDFHYICTEGLKYRDRFFTNQRTTFKVSVLVALFTASMGGGMAICACLAVLVALQRAEEGADRPLPFPFWLFGYNLHASPVYETLFCLSMVFTFFHTYVYVFMLQSQVLWIREITCKADMIKWNLQDLLIDVKPARNKEEANYYDALIKHRMRGIIKMHHSMIKLTEDYAAVFKKCLLYEQMLASPIICMTAYCFAEKFDAGEIQLILLLLCIAVIVVAFVPCYLCTHLLEKCQSISDACWDIPFWNAGPVLRVYLVLMMQRSMRPLPIVAAGFADISLQTYSNKLKAGEIQLILILLVAIVVVVMLIPSCLCTHLLEKCQSVGDACWEIPFWNAGPVLRVYLVLIMQRSMRQLPLVAPGFADVSLQTYSTIITRAYSCFNMLRQADFDIS